VDFPLLLLKLETEYETKNKNNLKPQSPRFSSSPVGGGWEGAAVMYYNQHTIIYANGEFVKAADAKTDFYSQSLHYGYAVFEGIRSYRTANGKTKIFKPIEHYDRLRHSAKAMNMPYEWDTNELTQITYEVLERNNLQNAYIRPIVYAPANMSFNLNTESFLVIAAWEMGAFLGNDLLRVKTSSFQRPNPKGFNITAKASGHYVNSILASQEAKAAGYNEALLTDMNGFVAEGPGANIFYEKDGILITPPPGNILCGITRATVIELAAERGIPVQEKLFTVEELKEADAVFYCGTAAEVIGWKSLDETVFPTRWEDTLSHQIEKDYKNLVVEKAMNVEPVVDEAEVATL
jgi:branched-chain amino acid aminotransferase